MPGRLERIEHDYANVFYSRALPHAFLNSLDWHLFSTFPVQTNLSYDHSTSKKNRINGWVNVVIFQIVI